MDDTLKELIEAHFEELKQECSNFRLVFRQRDAVVIGGLEFCIEGDEEQVIHRYHIAISISEDYPKGLPRVKEFSGNVPKIFHTNSTGELCLGVPSDLWLYLEGELTLSRFVKRCVIPFFCSLLENCPFLKFFRIGLYTESAFGV